MQITDENFSAEVLGRPAALVDFWASWCPPCKMMEPLVERLQSEARESTPILALNIDRNPQAAAKYQIASVPTFVLFVGGVEQMRRTGALTERQLREMLAAGDAAAQQSPPSQQSPPTESARPAEKSTGEQAVGERGYVTIVSGLPRSGTSLMMRMLEAGGVPVMTDRVRQADTDNPNGYYELEAVKQTRQNPAWLQQATGKAVKLVYRLLYDIPVEHQCRVLFMHRKLDEVLASQKVMLEHRQEPVRVPDAEMKRMLETELAQFEQWAARQRHLQFHQVDYNLLVNEPRAVTRQLATFLGGELNQEAMCRVVDPSLYRQRVA